MKVKPRRLAEQEFTYFRGQDNLEYYAGLLVEAKAEAEGNPVALANVEKIEAEIKALREDKVTFRIIPLSNGLQTHIAALGRARGDEFGADMSSISRDVVGYALKAITGLEDVDNAGNVIPFVLQFENKKLGTKAIKRVTDDCIEQLPSDVFGEIFERVQKSAGITVEEHKEINFTPACSEANSDGAMIAGQEITETTSSVPKLDIAKSTEPETMSVSG